MNELYEEMVERHQKEVNDFPIAFAFNSEQLAEALKKLDATLEECVVMDWGAIIRKTDKGDYLNLFKRHRIELMDAMKDESFAESAFLYEMDNHEYAINWNGDEDVLSCFGLDCIDLVKLGLDKAYVRARYRHMMKAENW